MNGHWASHEGKYVNNFYYISPKVTETMFLDSGLCWCSALDVVLYSITDLVAYLSYLQD